MYDDAPRLPLSYKPAKNGHNRNLKDHDQRDVSPIGPRRKRHRSPESDSEDEPWYMKNRMRSDHYKENIKHRNSARNSE